MEEMNEKSLFYHARAVKGGQRCFENVFQSVYRMIKKEGIDKIVINGQRIHDFGFFRKPWLGGRKHIVGWYEEINSFANFIRDAATGGSAAEMAYVLIGEPGNGKTFFVYFLNNKYRLFLFQEENRKYTFRFNNLNRLKRSWTEEDIERIIKKYETLKEKLETLTKFGIDEKKLQSRMLDELAGMEMRFYGNITIAESQTYEDPMILAMNLFEDREENKEYLERHGGFSGGEIDKLYENYRPLGACSAYIWNDILKFTNGNIEEMLDFVDIVPVPLSESMGTVTGKYPAKDKITSSAVDLLGEESIQRLLHITDTANPYRFDLRRGALARVAGGGIHFSDEIFKNKVDLVQVYLGVIQDRVIELEGYKWPLDTLVIATSNNAEFNRFKAESEQAPIIDRCRTCYVSHNTDYKRQEDLTRYAIGSKPKSTLTGEDLHEDPNLSYAASVAVVLTRLPHNQKLTPVETMKLAAGEIAGEKSIKALAEVIDELIKEQDITRRFGQKGIGQRNLGRAIQILLERTETHEGQCMFAYDFFKALERVIIDYVSEGKDREKYLKDLKTAKEMYRERIMTEMFNAYMDEPLAVRKDVMNYVNMIIGVDAENLGSDKMWKYKNPQTGELKSLKIDERFIISVEERLGLKTEEHRESFRTSVRKIYGQKIAVEPKYDFMDNVELVKAVTDVRLKSDIAGAGSLVGALANRTNEENQKLYNRMIDTMLNKLRYCKTCAQKTIEYFCTQEDES